MENKKITKFLFASLLTLFMSVEAQAVHVKGHVNKIDSTIDWIYAPNHSRRPSNRLGWFYGNQLSFWHYTSNPTNGADRSFGYFLYYTYDLYCLKKRGRKNCLGKNLRVNYRIAGRNKNGHKVMQVQVNGKSITSNYFQEVRKEFFEALEGIGGRAPTNNYQRSLIAPRPRSEIKTDFHVIVPKRGRNANAKWQRQQFTNRVLNRAKSEMFHLLPFKTSRIRTIKDQRDYDSKSQNSILREYDRSVQRRGIVSTVISGPKTEDAAGMAYLRHSRTPSFVMRSRYNHPNNQFSKQAIRNNALVFIHELGHNLLHLRHCSHGQRSICTDNVWNNKNYAREFLNRLRSIDAVRYSYAY